MLSTKNVIIDYTDVPVTWIFETYCKLNNPLTGQNEKMKSLFNVNDKTPSMYVYFDPIQKIYKYKDFSTNKSGHGINLVMELFKINFADAANKIITEYKDYLKNNKEYKQSEFKECPKFKIGNYTVRSWNKTDADFWLTYNIGTTILNKYNVKPLENYTLEKNDDGSVLETVTISNGYSYGYFKNDGSLYKIYQPKSSKKFLKINSYIQGSDQLENHHNLLITSSLKDVMSIKSLKLNFDCIAPDSENTMISKEVIKDLIKKYKNISVMFDNDEAGINAMKKYKELYDFNVFLLPLSKDLSDSIKDYGFKKVFYTFVPLINKSFDNGKS
jgi:hypothetical protein